MIVPSATARVYVVTLNWNRAEETCACLESVLRSDYPNLSVIVCDNASETASVTAIRNWISHTGVRLRGGRWLELEPSAAMPGARAIEPGDLILIHTGANLGFAGGMNVGVRFALAQHDADYVWLLNNDAVVEPTALTAALARMQADPRIGICGSTLIETRQPARIEALGGATYEPWLGRSRAIGAFSALEAIPADPQDVEARMSYVVGASMLVSRACLETIGVMEESYFLYSEELDWALAARRAGFKLGYAPASRVHHRQGSSIGTSPDGGSDLSLFYLFRSKVMFTWRNYPLFLPTVLLWLGFECAKFLLKGRPGKARAAVRGMLAAASGAGFH